MLFNQNVSSVWKVNYQTEETTDIKIKLILVNTKEFWEKYDLRMYKIQLYYTLSITVTIGVIKTHIHIQTQILKILEWKWT